MFTFITQRRLNQERRAVHLVLIQHTKMLSFLTRRRLNQKSGQLYSTLDSLSIHKDQLTQIYILKIHRLVSSNFKEARLIVKTNLRLFKVPKQSLLQVYQLTG